MVAAGGSRARGSWSDGEPATVGSFVEQLHRRSRRPQGFPPTCGASARVIDAAGEAITFRRVDDSGVIDLPRAPASGRTPSSAPTFRTGVTYVSVPVVVHGADGKAVAGLTGADFRLYENGVSQKVDRVLPMESVINVALIVDASSSMRGEWTQLRNALLRFVYTLGRDDRVLLASFDERVLVDAEFTSDRDQLLRAVSEMDRRTGTRLYDAVGLMVTKRMQSVAGRKAIVLLTDGVDTRSRLENADSTLELISESHVPVYAIQYDTSRNDYSLPYGVKSGDMTIREMRPTAMPEGAADSSVLFKRADEYSLRSLN